MRNNSIWRGAAVLSVASTILMVAGCASGPGAGGAKTSVADILNEERMAVLHDTSNFAEFRSRFTQEELRFLHEHIGEVEQQVNAQLVRGWDSSAWVAGYFRIESSLPLMRRCLLADRGFYGWEGPDPNDESSYLLDMQHPSQMAYMAAIEAVTGKPLREAVALQPEEMDGLKSEANIDFSRREPEFEKVERGLCARWLLSKLVPEAAAGK